LGGAFIDVTPGGAAVVHKQFPIVAPARFSYWHGGYRRAVYTMRAKTMNSEDKHYLRCDRIAQLIRKRPGISATELNWATESIKPVDRNAIIDALIEDGVIQEKVTLTGGRPKRCYWPATPAASPISEPEARSDDGEFVTVKLTPYEITLINAERQRQNEISAAHGLPLLPLIPLSP
jgi:hypothetical protein